MADRVRPPQLDRAQYLATDTIAAVSSALGGAIALLRVSGPRAFAITDRLAPARKSPWRPRHATLCRLQNIHGQPLDEAVVTVFTGPDSYTGEDLIELSVHGGAWVATRVLESLLEAGARQALPGEFSFRAVRNGKLTLTQAQAVVDLIEASNDGAVTLALEKLSGSQNRALTDIAQKLRSLLVLAEAGIDFSDQDLDEVSLPRLKTQSLAIRDQLTQLQSSFGRGLALQDGIRLAIVGLPNAGKSSLFNALLGEDRSIVSSVAGTTRDTIREKLTLRNAQESYTFRIEDTAGLRQTDDSIEAEGVRRATAAATRADLVLWVVDPTQPLIDSLAQWRALAQGAPRLAGAGSETLIAFTKSDLQSPSERIAFEAALRRELPRSPAGTWSSALDAHSGTADLVEVLLTLARARCARAPGEILLTRPDQLRSVEQAGQALTRAADAPEIDLFSADLKGALHALQGLIGETTPDDILGRIFSEFCIGK